MVEGEVVVVGGSGSSYRKRFTSPSMVVGVSCSCGVIEERVEAEDGEVEEEEDEGAEQIMNVSLSWSKRQDCCMECSSGRVRGSEAVAFCIS